VAAKPSSTKTKILPFQNDVSRSSQCLALPYPGCSRCTWHARHVQRRHPTQRGMLKARRIRQGSINSELASVTTSAKRGRLES
jgi:hypothetical protein